MAEAGGKPAEAAGWASLSSVGRLWVWRGGGTLFSLNLKLALRFCTSVLRFQERVHLGSLRAKSSGPIQACVGM